MTAASQLKFPPETINLLVESQERKNTTNKTRVERAG
eukprot:SAG22_NODE_18784_length_281_cov_1.126374_1_plen_36_part_01